MDVMPAPLPGPAQMPGYPPLPAQWTFWADTIIGHDPLGHLQPSAFSASRVLSGFGSGAVTLPVTSSAMDQARLLKLWSWRLWAYYGGRPWWCGVPTGIADDSGPTASLTLTELPGYLEKRQFDVHPSQRFDQVEQVQIAATLAAPVTDVGVSIITNAGPGFPRDRTYEYLESDSRAQLLKNLSEVISGPQYRAEYSVSSAGRPVCSLRIAYPRVGGPTGLGVSVPGSATGFDAKWDADELRTRTFAVGEVPEDAPEGTPKPVAVKDLPQAGLPRLDEVDDYPGVILQSTLIERAASMSVQHAQPVLDLTASAVASSPPLTSYAPGDDVTVRVATPLLPGGLDVTGQLTEVSVNAATGAVTWTVAVTQPPPRARETLSGRLDRIDLTVRSAYRRRMQPLT